MSIKWDRETPHPAGWMFGRFKRQFSELVRLAVPTMGMRVGMLTLNLVDMAMVGHFATAHLAWLNLANQSIIMFTNVIALGILMGVMVYTSNAYGAKDYQECGRVWRRSLPFTGFISLFVLLLSIPAPFILEALGQAPEITQESGKIIQILGIGMPGQILFICCFMFLEGVKRPDVGLKIMVIANIVNIGLNILLIYGVNSDSALMPYTGFIPSLGAEGSAWTTTVVRWIMGLGMMLYIWHAPSLRRFGVRDPHGQRWSDWADQRQLGYASGVSLAAEVIAFSALVIFAGWLGTIPLAAHGVVSQVNGLPLMISLGIGGAAAVRVGIAFSRRDRLDTILAGISALILNVLIVGGLGVSILLMPAPLIGIFSNDTAVQDALVSLALLFVLMMFFDAAQMLVSNFLRGVKETWIPTVIQSTSFIGVMLPACYILAFTFEMGLKGLFLGTLMGVVVSMVIQLLRFIQLTKKPTS
ncbi:MATE family efflux transporter [Temperatibacter marinus]|uniref:MATE family efflux transporter n=1 Tax=Temperatibacter marinus TaxID=1456591 RepID=A0AA52EK19_9PROT|nr:MATE family efflux transporter [Temperatibacter marinus]WND03957.1 MATE family efflux transporter [Temperatibacter marinus]